MNEQKSMSHGISIIICAHNSRSRIVPTLTHLAAQNVPDSIPWEVLLIDNGSTDDTALVAQQAWTGSVPLRIIHEPTLGLRYARWRGIDEACYEIVSFVDDDNWVDEMWVATVADIMAHHADVGACGGPIEGIYEDAPPPWLHEYVGYYAITKGHFPTGDTQLHNSRLVGAGLSIRRDALLTLRAQGFRSLLTGRRGNSLASGEDIELCLALRLAGWRLWYDNRLQLQHFMPANRLRWSYLRRLVRAAGMGGMTNEAYRVLLARDEFRSRWKRTMRFTWQGQLLRQLWPLLRNFNKVVKTWLWAREGDPDVIWIESQFGRLLGILQQRRIYNENLATIQQSAWFVHGAVSSPKGMDANPKHHEQSWDQSSGAFMIKAMKAFAHRIRGFLLAPLLQKGTTTQNSDMVAQLQLKLTYQNLVATGQPLPPLRESGFKAFSQSDEDGKLLYIFSILGTTNKTSVEICAGSGIECNSANLILNHGWTGLLVDGNEHLVKKGVAFYRASPYTYVYPPKFVHAWITRENVNALIEKNGFKGEIDLLSIDMDGVDYWIWDAIHVIEPRVVIVEYNDILGPDKALTVPYADQFNASAYGNAQGAREFVGASLMAFMKIANKKGYRLVGCNEYGYNAIFIKNPLGEKEIPEIPVADCFRHPKVLWGMQERFPKVKDFPWVEV